MVINNTTPFRSPMARLLATSCLSLLVTSVGMNAFANPSDGVVAAGQASISASGKKLDVHQQSDKAVIDWRGFDIAVDEHTQFHQPSSAAIALNRVNSTSASRIDGQLTANGNVVIVNQNGVMFGAGATVDVNGLVVSTSDIENDDFMADQPLAFTKPGQPDAAIVNEGSITAAESGLVGLVAPQVTNKGMIQARLGHVALASGDTATIDIYGDGLLEIALSDDVTKQLVSNEGSITADGGVVTLQAAAARNIIDTLVSNKGTLQSNTVAAKRGNINLHAGQKGACNKPVLSKRIVPMAKAEKFTLRVNR